MTEDFLKVLDKIFADLNKSGNVGEIARQELKGLGHLWLPDAVLMIREIQSDTERWKNVYKRMRKHYGDALLEKMIEIAELEEANEQLSAESGELLAVIHRDGGHYLTEHGLEKAVRDAIESVVHDRAENESLKMANEQMKAFWKKNNTWDDFLAATDSIAFG